MVVDYTKRIMLQVSSRCGGRWVAKGDLVCVAISERKDWAPANMADENDPPNFVNHWSSVSTSVTISRTPVVVFPHTDSPASSPLVQFVLVSYHGDSDGLSAVPVVKAVQHVSEFEYPSHYLIAGIDANTISPAAAVDGVESAVASAAAAATTNSTKVQQHQNPTTLLVAVRPKNFRMTVPGFADFLRAEGLVSCWGPEPPERLWTSRKARTIVQPQVKICIHYLPAV